MNTLTAHIQFKVFLDKNSESVAFGGAPAFLPEEIDIFLNQAQLEILSNKITGNNALKQTFESDVSATSELDRLIKTDQERIHHVDFNEFRLNDLHKGGERMTIMDISLKYGQYNVNAALQPHNVAKLYKQTYNNVPWVETPVAMIEDDTLYMYVDPILMQDDKYLPEESSYYLVYITYIKKPKEFDYTNPNEELDFPEDVMNEIIGRAVTLALENVESQRANTKLQLNNLSV